MKFGHFDDARKEYVITTPRTPLPWINYLGSEDFFSLVSNTAGGYSFYRDARMRRLTRYRYNSSPLDMDGHHIYIKDGDTVWNPGWQPTKTELDSYACRHGLGYTILEGEKNGVSAAQELFVPTGDACELDRLTLKNKTDAVKELDVFSYVEFCLWDAIDDSSNFQRNFSTGEVEVEPAIIYHKTEYRERRNHYAVFWSNTPVTSFDTTRDAFCGVYGGPADPQAVRAGHCSGSIAHGWAPVGALHIHVTLAPGEEKKILFGLGYIENPQDEKFTAPGVINKERAHAMIARYATDAQVDAARKALADHWEALLSTYHLESGEEKLDRMVNIWHQYQCMVTFNMSRSASYFESGTGRGMGFRDSCQDLLGFVHIIPSRARERILDIAATQFEDGSAYHQYQPLTKKGNRDIGTGFNDDPLWLIAGTAAYLRETGDWSILDEQVPFDNDASKAQSLMEHLRRSFNFTVTHLGPHGLPLIGRADWNDCLNLGGGESAMVSFLHHWALQNFIALAEQLGEMKDAAEYTKIAEHVKEVSESALWDGKWYIRGITAGNRKIGTQADTEGRVHMESNTWAVLSGVADHEHGISAMDSVDEYLYTPYGLMLNAPCFTTPDDSIGFVTRVYPGLKENGAVFSHPNPWAWCAEAILGRGSRAMKFYNALCPALQNDIIEVRQSEPYSYCQFVVGKDHTAYGRARHPFMTGSSGWAYFAATQYMLGIRPDFDGITVDPCIPADWKEFSVSRKWRGAEYHIHVTNPDAVEKGVRSITMNGKQVRKLPVLPVGTVCDVEVVMG